MNSQTPSQTLNGAFPKCLLAAAITVLISPAIARTLLFAGFALLAASPEQPLSISTFLELVGMTFMLVLTFGSIFWVPLLLLALFPGYDLWKTTFTQLRSKGVGPQVSVACSTLTVLAFVAAIGVVGMTVILGEDLFSSFSFILRNGWPACFIAPLLTWVLFRRRVGGFV